MYVHWLQHCYVGEIVPLMKVGELLQPITETYFHPHPEGVNQSSTGVRHKY